MSEFAYVNTDSEIWRKVDGDYYSPSVHKTASGKIGISVGGYVFVKDVRDWHKLAKDQEESEEVTVDTELALVEGTQASEQVIEMLANLARRVTQLESQLRDTQRNVERHAEELENAKHRISKHATMFGIVEEKVEMLSDDVKLDRKQIINAINRHYTEGSR